VATGRSCCAPSLLADSRVLVTGGIVDQGDVVASADIFDPSSGAWAPTEPMTMPRTTHGSVTLADGRVLIMGGLQAITQFNRVEDFLIEDENTVPFAEI